jgi:uncharacterized protein YwlG (UPF0340 family)
MLETLQVGEIIPNLLQLMFMTTVGVTDIGITTGMGDIGDTIIGIHLTGV